MVANSPQVMPGMNSEIHYLIDIVSEITNLSDSLFPIKEVV